MRRIVSVKLSMKSGDYPGNLVVNKNFFWNKVNVELLSMESNSALLKLSVRDSGIGIPPDRMGNLFSVFTQVDGSITRKYGGTGLGLSIVKKLTELMGGNVGVESVQGQGSTFWFTCPFALQKAGFESNNKRAELAGTKILVVDDKVNNRIFIGSALREWNCEYSEAENGETAFTMLVKAAENNKPFQIALIDYSMPDINGEELGKKIKSASSISSTLCILLTSQEQRGDAARMEQAGFDGYLLKPVQSEFLKECLALALGRHSMEKSHIKSSIITRHTIAEIEKRNTRILVVEDNLINQAVTQAHLNTLGYSSECVNDGILAIEKLKQMRYDIIFMDIQMPIMDGLQATKLIRDPDSGVLDHDVSIIATTANAMKGDRERYIEAGMNDYIAKPIELDILLKILEKYVPVSSIVSNAKHMKNAGDLMTYDPESSPVIFKGNSGELLDKFKRAVNQQKPLQCRKIIKQLNEEILNDEQKLVLEWTVKLIDEYRFLDADKHLNTFTTVQS